MRNARGGVGGRPGGGALCARGRGGWRAATWRKTHLGDGVDDEVSVQLANRVYGHFSCEDSKYRFERQSSGIFI
jgi:hypothetical protein